MRQINQVRTDTLEMLIAGYRAQAEWEAADAIEALAKSIGAPISEEAIQVDVDRRKAFYVKMETQGVSSG